AAPVAAPPAAPSGGGRRSCIAGAADFLLFPRRELHLLPEAAAEVRRAAGAGAADAAAGRTGARRYPGVMPELPEMEAWRRQLDDPVSAFPIVKAGPAHIATLKTFDPPLAALEGRKLAGAERRA